MNWCSCLFYRSYILRICLPICKHHSDYTAFTFVQLKIREHYVILWICKSLVPLLDNQFFINRFSAHWTGRLDVASWILSLVECNPLVNAIGMVEVAFVATEDCDITGGLEFHSANGAFFLFVKFDEGFHKRSGDDSGWLVESTDVILVSVVGAFSHA